MSSPVLDAPDQQIQMIMMKMFLGERLTTQERSRWANRQHVERQVLKEGGSMKATATPNESPEEAGMRETNEAMQYLVGREKALAGGGQRGGPTAQQPANPRMRKGSGVKDDGTAYGKNYGSDYVPGGSDQFADSMAAFRKSMDRVNAGDMSGFQISRGGSAMDNPGGVRGRMQPTDAEKAAGMSVDYEPEAGVPDGSGYAQGPDGGFMSFGPGGARGQYGSRKEMMQAFAGQSQGQAAPAPRSIEDEEAYIRNAGYGDFLDQMQPAPVASIPMSTSGQNRAMLDESRAPSMENPAIRPAPRSAEDTGITAAPRNSEANPGITAAPRQAPRNTGMDSYAYDPNSGKPAPGWAQNAMQPKQASTPMFPKAIWNSPSASRPKQFQATADRFNPFYQSGESKRRLSVLSD